MGLFSFIKGQFIDVIEWPQEDRDRLVWKFPRGDNEIKNGAQLTVREGQVALFVSEGELGDVFGPGRQELATRNLPILTSLRSWKYGFDSPFKADVYFLSTRQFSNMKWGTRNPIMVSDPEFSLVQMRAFGTFNFRITDAAKFYREFAGNKASIETEDILDHFRSKVVAEFSTALKKSGKTLQEINMRANELGDDLLPLLQEDFTEIGLELTEFVVENVSLPEDIQKELTAQDFEFRKMRRAGTIENEVELQNLMGKAQLSQNIGDINKYMQFQMASGMNNPQGNGGAGTSGMSGDMGEMMKMMMAANVMGGMAQNLQGSFNPQVAAAANPANQGQVPASNAPASNAPAEGEPEMTQEQVMATLKQLGELKAAGVLTDAEFEAKKAELLKRL